MEISMTRYWQKAIYLDPRGKKREKEQHRSSEICTQICWTLLQFVIFSSLMLVFDFCWFFTFTQSFVCTLTMAKRTNSIHFHWMWMYTKWKKNNKMKRIWTGILKPSDAFHSCIESLCVAWFLYFWNAKPNESDFSCDGYIDILLRGTFIERI